MQRGHKDDRQDDGTDRRRRAPNDRCQQLTSHSNLDSSTSNPLFKESRSDSEWPSLEAAHASDWKHNRRLNYPSRSSTGQQQQPLHQSSFDSQFSSRVGIRQFRQPFPNYYPPANYYNPYQGQPLGSYSHYPAQSYGQYYPPSNGQPYYYSYYDQRFQQPQLASNVASTEQGNSAMKRFLTAAEISSLINRFRTWKVTKAGRELDAHLSADRRLSDRSLKFQVTSYNILSQDLLEYHNILYNNCPHNALRWKERFTKLTGEISRLQSNVYCLQEVNEHHFENDLEPFFYAYGYKTLYKKRPNKEDGCAIVYDDKVLRLIKSNEVELNQRSVHRSLDRENVAIIGLFEPQNSQLKKLDAKVVIATTHLLFNPKRGDIKMNQLRLLLAEIRKMAQKDSGIDGQSDTSYKASDHYPVILCGDFNTLPGSPIHQFLIKGKLDALGLKSGDLSGQEDGVNKGKDVTQFALQMNGIGLDSRFTDDGLSSSSSELEEMVDDMNNIKSSPQIDRGSEPQTSEHCQTEQSLTLTHDFKFRSVHPSFDGDDNETPFVSTHHSLASCLVDYIFVSKVPDKAHSQTKLKCLSYQRLPNAIEAAKIGMLPNEYIGSDHLSLSAQFIISPNK